MKLEQIQYIVEIAKTGSISVAAKNMHISQAGISKALANFEKEYDVKLFKRNKNGTFPTEEGKRIIVTATDLLVKFYNLEKELRNENSSNQTTIKISSTADVIINVLSDALVSFKKIFPNVDIIITQKDADDVVKDVKEGKVDLGFASLYEEIIRENTLSFEVLFEGKLYTLVSKESHLASYKTLTPIELINEPIALYDGVNMKQLVKKITEHYGPMKILVTTNNTEVIKKIIANNQAIGFAPNLFNDPYLIQKDINLIPLMIPYATPRFYGCIELKGKKLSKAALNFKEIVKDKKHGSGVKTLRQL